MTPEERTRIWERCERWWDRHPRRSPKQLLQALAEECPSEARADHYGAGGLVEELEAVVAALLGKPACVYMPSGTMAQQIALRLHAEARGTRHVAFHPTSHLELHEQGAYRHVHRLEAAHVGTSTRLLRVADLEAVPDPLGAVLVELPQRELGGVLPAWEELEELRDWAEGAGVALHLDGARLWESAPHYDRSLPEIAGLFDSVYVSFYKTLGAISGAALVGSEELVSRARVWLRRHGGNLVAQWPEALSARRALAERLERVPRYCAAARDVAAKLSTLPGVEVLPDPPHTNMFHVLFRADPEALLDASARIGSEYGIGLVRYLAPTEVPGVFRHEFTAGDCTLELDMGELQELLRLMLEYAGAAASD